MAASRCPASRGSPALARQASERLTPYADCPIPPSPSPNSTSRRTAVEPLPCAPRSSATFFPSVVRDSGLCGQHNASCCTLDSFPVSRRDSISPRTPKLALAHSTRHVTLGALGTAGTERKLLLLVSLEPACYARPRLLRGGDKMPHTGHLLREPREAPRKLLRVYVRFYSMRNSRRLFHRSPLPIFCRSAAPAGGDGGQQRAWRAGSAVGWHGWSAASTCSRGARSP